MLQRTLEQDLPFGLVGLPVEAIRSRMVAVVDSICALMRDGCGRMMEAPPAETVPAPPPAPPAPSPAAPLPEPATAEAQAK